MISNPVGEETYRQVVQMILERAEVSGFPMLERHRRAFAIVGDEKLPDCASHGDDSFQEDHFSGIPTTLCINIGFFAISVLIFSFIRKNAWNYGLLAFQRDESGILTSHDRNIEPDPYDAHIIAREGTSKNPFYWIKVVFKMSDNEIERKSGKAAVHYLTFQRYLMSLSGIMTIISLIGPLPANIAGQLFHNASDAYFAKTTIGNLSNDNLLLWVHVVAGVAMYGAAFYLMRRFTTRHSLQQPDSVRGTVMVRNVPSCVTEEHVKTHFFEAYGFTPLDIQIATDNTKVLRCQETLVSRQIALQYLVDEFDVTRIRPLISTSWCGCGARKVDGISYYEELTRAASARHAELLSSPQTNVGVFFATFPTEHALHQRIVKDFRWTPCKIGSNRSSLTNSLRCGWWSVRHAPLPSDILWCNLSTKGWRWHLNYIVINVLLFLMTLFLTTPAFVVQTIENLNLTDPIQHLIEEKSPLVASYIPTLLLWTFSALLPILVWYGGHLERHWTSSSTHFHIMQKTYGFLLLMVLIMPSIGLGSVSVLLEFLFSKDHPNEAVNRFECIFLSDNGSFFVNYIIFAAFLGTALELLRIPELLNFGIRLLFTSSVAERNNVKRKRTFEFEFGLHYAWLLTIFTVQSSYSLAVPVINIFGFIYLGVKHLIDRYNLYFAYLPSRISKRIHDRAVEITLMATRFGLLFILFFTLLRYDIASGELSNRPIAVVILTILCLFQAIAFAPELSELFPSITIFKELSVLQGSKCVLSEETIVASDFKPDVFITESVQDIQTQTPQTSSIHSELLDATDVQNNSLEFT